MCASENGVQYGDLPEYDDFNYIANVARVNAASLAALALAPARPKNVGVVTARLTNDTDLKWDANKEPDLAGYEIVWRDTTSPVWTNARACRKCDELYNEGNVERQLLFRCSRGRQAGQQISSQLSPPDALKAIQAATAPVLLRCFGFIQPIDRRCASKFQ